VKLPQIHDGQWVRPFRRGFILECCKCGIRHRLNFRLRAGHIEFQPFRIRPRKKRQP